MRNLFLYDQSSSRILLLYAYVFWFHVFFQEPKFEGTSQSSCKSFFFTYLRRRTKKNSSSEKPQEFIQNPKSRFNEDTVRIVFNVFITVHFGSHPALTRSIDERQNALATIIGVCLSHQHFSCKALKTPEKKAAMGKFYRAQDPSSVSNSPQLQKPKDVKKHQQLLQQWLMWLIVMQCLYVSGYDSRRAATKLYK